jgi:soluble lytic murein transglycosylase-like protein
MSLFLFLKVSLNSNNQIKRIITLVGTSILLNNTNPLITNLQAEPNSKLEKIINNSEQTTKYISNGDIDIYINNIYKKIKVSDIIDKEFIKSLIDIESSRNANAISTRGARGLMQLTEDTWNEMDKSNFYDNSFNPEKNIEVGIKYLKWITNYYITNYPNWNQLSEKDKQEYIATAYNGGIGLLKKKGWDIEKMPNETKNYVDSLNTNGDTK